jgi:hypothetical protein
VLYLVLGLVLAAFGLLIAALTTANTLFAWLSVTVSVIAAGLLVLDWFRGRRKARENREAAEDAAAEPLRTRTDRPFGDQRPPLTETGPGAPARDQPAEPARTEAQVEPAAAILADTSAESYDGYDDDHEEDFEDDEELTEQLPEERPVERRAERAVHRTVQEPVADETDETEETGEPDEEQTDAADLLVVADLSYEVRVVDEHPRYHLVSCRYLFDKPTIPLPVAEARQLGFTPCVRCGPDATLAARHRASR